MNNCQDKPILFSDALWKALMNLPALRYMKAPVDFASELYEKYPAGNEKGTFAFVYDENNFYTYHPRGWNRGKWLPISGGLGSFFEINPEFLQQDDILVYDSSKKKFVIKSGNVWNKLPGDIKDSFSQVTKFLNQVDEAPVDSSDSGVYFVHNDTFRALYTVLNKKSIKIFNSSDYKTKEEVNDDLDKKANQTQVDEMAIQIGQLEMNKADKSVVDALQAGVIMQPVVDTYNDTSGGKTSLFSSYPNPQIGWDVLVRNDENKGGKSNRYNWNGSVWVDMETGVYDEDVATKEELSSAILLLGNKISEKADQSEVDALSAKIDGLSPLVNSRSMIVTTVDGSAYSFDLPNFQEVAPEGEAILKYIGIAAGDTVLFLYTEFSVIDWGDGTVDSINSHTYSTAGDYTIKVKGLSYIGSEFASVGDVAKKLTEITLPYNLSKIENRAFQNCTGLETVSIPKGALIKEIGAAAFENTTSLKSIAIPDNCETIHQYAFIRASLENINLSPSSKLKTIGSAALAVTKLKSFFMPDSVVEIEPEAFADNPDMKVLEFGQNIKLKTLPRRFAYGSGIEKLTIPDSIEEIGVVAFEASNSLSEVFIGKNSALTLIGAQAFLSCGNLKKVTCLVASPPVLGDPYVFFGVNPDFKIYVPAENLEAYKTANIWNNYANIIYPY